jgi:hypothetical protein
LSNSLESFILAQKTLADIRNDLKTQFPPFASLTDDVLDRYIDLSFCNVPSGFVNCGFDCAYKAFLYGLAHNLAYNNVLGGESSIPSIKKNASSKSADGISISYDNNISKGVAPNIYNYFSTTSYGIILLSLFDSCGLSNSCGGFVV